MGVEQREPAFEPGRPVERAEFRDRIRWGPVIAGLLTTLTTFLILGILGTAIGMTVFDEGSDGATVGTGAAIWGILSALIAFLLGGWIASWAANQTSDTDATLNGVMVAIAAIVVLLWLVGTGVGYLFGAVTANLELIAETGAGIATGDIEAAAGQAALDEAATGTWATLIGFLAAIAAAALGGWMGRRTVEPEPVPTEPRGRARA